MTNHPDDLDAALRQWGDDQRHTSADVTDPPAIADLLGARRRRYNVVAVAASAVVVAALAIGLALGVHFSSRHQTQAIVHGGPGQPTSSRVTSSTAPCWQQFADAGSTYDSTTRTELAVLRYAGKKQCAISENPQLALVDVRGKVVGRHAAPNTLAQIVTVRAGETVRMTIKILDVCIGIPDGRYSLLIGFRPSGHPLPGDMPLLPVERLIFPRDSTCPIEPLVSAQTLHFATTPDNQASTITRLARIARHESRVDRDPHAVAEAVLTTASRIASRDLMQLVGSSGRARIWIVQLHGRLTATDCAIPTGGSGGCPVGTYLHLAFRQPGLQQTGLSLNGHRENLANLGTVVPLLP
ncbi:hypothetical protein [Jatrophihabitans endophyticus]|uniref:hypothetical protein n=1 Tax=Jatrophihabitans endophyticus TaxID=1206085 RepID=UPI0019E092F5|nr:hypothetical protein [Jatrophihabitans endophyticus]MBE7186930.1 hypothetical protein [Jatrophihabitans endophyticus]